MMEWLLETRAIPRFEYIVINGIAILGSVGAFAGWLIVKELIYPIKLSTLIRSIIASIPTIAQKRPNDKVDK